MTQDELDQLDEGFGQWIRGLTKVLRVLSSDEEIRANTAQRTINAFKEMTSGQFGPSPKDILSKTFPPDPNEEVGIVLVDNLQFTSVCAHHTLAFHGIADIAYIPNERIVGLSKIPRLLECRSRRLQMQESLGSQIANDLVEHLNPLGVAVRLTAQHDCMTCRGVRSTGRMITSVMRGAFLKQGTARNELMMLLAKS